MKKCPHCNSKLSTKIKLDWEKVKVGDTLFGFSTNKAIEVLAIGKSRFLYMDKSGRESVGSKFSISANWRKKPLRG